MDSENSARPAEPIRAAGLRQLESFVGRAGKGYKENHRYDLGRDSHLAVSRLSAYLRYRLISESEVAEAVLGQHTAAEAETFLNELLWRTYCKGWLEGRPQVYLAYRRVLADDLRRFSTTNSYASAVEGRTGISAFDEWNRELLETGYLHSRARAWYASIWIFTLRLPWTLGANHFHQHLLDGDPASNTLNWRSVAGLHTPGKHYLAQADDIAKYTRGRFDLKGRLNESAVPQSGPAVPPSRLIQFSQTPSALVGDRYALWVTPDDLSPEVTQVGTLKPEVVIVSGLRNLDRSYSFSPMVRDFVEGAIDDATARLSAAYGCPVEMLPEGDNPGALLGTRLTGDGIPHLVYYQPPVGPWQELATAMTARDVGLKYFPLRRSWDAHLYPHASKGYTPFQKAALPTVVRLRGKV